MLVYVFNTYTLRCLMQKKLTITVEEEVYVGLHKIIGRRRISQFIEDLVRPHVTNTDLEAGYRAMAQDEAREAEALEWSEATIEDVADATR
jgi:predicted CopG family antitoxin